MNIRLIKHSVQLSVELRVTFDTPLASALVDELITLIGRKLKVVENSIERNWVYNTEDVKPDLRPCRRLMLRVQLQSNSDEEYVRVLSIAREQLKELKVKFGQIDSK